MLWFLILFALPTFTRAMCAGDVVTQNGYYDFDHEIVRLDAYSIAPACGWLVYSVDEFQTAAPTN